jgi:inner membrane protein
MPTVFSHAVVGLAIGTTAPGHGSAGRLALASALCAVVPDLDVVGVRLGVPWGHVLGHRGITHSLSFAAVLAAVVVALAFPDRALTTRRWMLWLVLFTATASHGLLDAMTDGGSGVAFFAPFADSRYFLPWRPIPVSPIGVSWFLGARGLAIMKIEVALLWIPAFMLSLVCFWLRRGTRA